MGLIVTFILEIRGYCYLRILWAACIRVSLSQESYSICLCGALNLIFFYPVSGAKFFWESNTVTIIIILISLLLLSCDVVSLCSCLISFLKAFPLCFCSLGELASENLPQISHCWNLYHLHM